MIHRYILYGITAIILTRSAFTEQGRPKIGVVLGGGGALGFAHIGVLQVLENQRIPIDYIAGTSMGAIVAGMYTSGMSPDEMEQAFLELDWWDVLRDQSPHQFLDYRQKIVNKRYFGLEFGLQNWKPVFSPGMAYGQKLNNILGTFSINSVGIEDFDQLNIPYRAVATDLRGGTCVVLKNGNLAHAMRASMAVPGVFTPVQTDDMVLVDGGILNNIPVDVAKDMGADIVIAVDVGASAADKSKAGDFTSLGDVVGRVYTIIQRPEQERQLAFAELVIAPDLADASSSQFHRADLIIPEGRIAAEKEIEHLKSYVVDQATYDIYLKKQRRKHSKQVRITSVSIDGNENVPDEAIQKRIRSETGPLNLTEIYNDLNRIHGMGLFQTVTYQLLPDGDGYALSYEAVEKFWGPTFLHLGMKIESSTDTSMLWSILMNYTRTEINSLGGEVRIDLEGGGNIRHFDGEWYQPLSPARRFFLAPSIMLSSETIDFYVGDIVVADVEEELAYGKLDVGISGYEYGEARIGILGGSASDYGNVGPIVISREDDTVAAATTGFTLDQLDDPVFAKKGFRASVDGLFAHEDAGSSETFSTLEAEILLPLTLGKNTVTTRLTGGTSLGTELPFYALFQIGGIDGFAGYAPYQLYGQYYGIASFSHRYELGRLPPTLGSGIYSLMRFDAGNAWFERDQIGFNNLTYAGLIGLEADTLLGKCSIAVSKAEGIKTRLYFSIGNAF